MCSPEGSFVLHRRFLAAAQHDVEAIPKRLHRDGAFPIELRDQAVARFFVRGAIKNWIVRYEWVAREIHLSHKTRRECRPKQRKMNVRRAPRIMVIAPGIFSGPNRHEAVAAFGIGHRVAAAAKVWVERRVVLVALVEIT